MALSLALSSRAARSITRGGGISSKAYYGLRVAGEWWACVEDEAYLEAVSV